MPARLSVIVPARNAEATLERCLQALAADADAATEIIVVDDGSTDGTASLALAAGARLVRSRRSRGPGPARNLGAGHARGDLLVFVDADVAIAPGSLALIRRRFAQEGCAALFGSYDAAPSETGFVSRFRNLQHHFVHQHGPESASHFWTGLGAIRRHAFLELGGFDEGRYARALEDVELGYRLRRRGFDIRLDKSLQGKHLKRWTLRTMLYADFALRAAPWIHLLVERGGLPDDLSLDRRHRLSVLTACLIPAALAAAPLSAAGPAAAGALALAFAACNRRLFAFFARQHGIAFALGCLPLHLLQSLSAGLGALYGLGLLLASRDAAPAWPSLWRRARAGGGRP